MNTDYYFFTNQENKEFIYDGNSNLIFYNHANIQPNHLNSLLTKQISIADFEEEPWTPIGEEKPSVRQLTLLITNACNMKCVYCYERANSLDETSSMNLDVLQAAVEELQKQFGFDQKVNLLFFGGEPLLNFDFLRRAVDFLNDFGMKHNITFNYQLTTNGTILNQEIQQFLVDYRIGVMVSVDGFQEQHDLQRRFHNGEGTYRRIAQNVAKLVPEIELTARVTLTDFQSDLIRLFQELTALGFQRITIEPAGIRESRSAAEKFRGFDLQLAGFADFFISSLRENKLLGFNNLTRTMTLLHQGKNRKLRFLPCIAGDSSFALSSNGEFYLCHRFAGITEYQWGDIVNGFNHQLRAAFLPQHRMEFRNHHQCRLCWARFLCGGSCYYTAYVVNQDSQSVNELQCLFNREIIKTALYIYSSLTKEERLIFNHV